MGYGNGWPEIHAFVRSVIDLVTSDKRVLDPMDEVNAVSEEFPIAEAVGLALEGFNLVDEAFEWACGDGQR